MVCSPDLVSPAPDSPGGSLRGAARGAVVGRLIVVLALSLASRASAQSSAEVSGARAAAEQGLDAFDAEHYDQAVDLFTRAESIVHSPVHLLFLARSESKLGRLVAAKEHYMKVVTEVLPRGASPVFVDAQKEAEAELAALQPRIPRLTVTLRQSGDGKQSKTEALVLDGTQLSAALIGLPQPVDPGEHEVTVHASGMKASTEKVTLVEGAEASVVVALQPDPSASASQDAASPAHSATLTPADAVPKGSGTLTLVGYGALGVGVLGVAAGTYFGLTARSTLADANTLCQTTHPGAPAGACVLDTSAEQSKVKDLDDKARSQNTLATVGFIAGGVGLAAGITLLLVDRGAGASSGSAARGTSPGPHESAQPRKAASVTLRPWVGVGSAGLSGTF